MTDTDLAAAAITTALAALDDRTTIIHSDLAPSNVLMTPDD